MPVVQTAKAGAGATSSAVETDWKSASPQPSLYDGVAWRDAAVAWLAQRLILLALTYFELWRLALHSSAAEPFPTPSRVLHVWTTWDSAIYASIAQGGYSQLEQAAFFPLYPFLERLLAPLVGGNPAVAGLIISNVACLVAFAWLRVLVERECGRAVARRTLLYVVIFPYSLFLVAAYTEALFLLLSLATFLALRGGHWKLAGLVAALATLTRPVGILLLVPLVYAYWTSRFGAGMDKPRWPRVEDVAALLLPVLALVGFELALALHYGTLMPTASAEASGWGRSLTWPWNGILWAGLAVLQDSVVVKLFVALTIFWMIFFAALALASLWPAAPARARLPLAYGLYAGASTLLVLMTPIYLPAHYAAALLSSPRYMGVVFPLFMVLAGFTYTRPFAHRLIFAIFLAVASLLAVDYIAGGLIG